MTLLTADDVLNEVPAVSSYSRRATTRMRSRRVPRDEVTTTMREFEERLGTSQYRRALAPEVAEILLTSEGVRNIRFLTTRWSGYHIDQVDAFLAQVVSTMEARGAGAHQRIRRPARCRSIAGAYSGRTGGGTYGMSPAQAVRPGRPETGGSVRRGDRPARPVHRPAPAGGRLPARRARGRPAPAVGTAGAPAFAAAYARLHTVVERTRTHDDF